VQPGPFHLAGLDLETAWNHHRCVRVFSEVESQPTARQVFMGSGAPDMSDGHYNILFLSNHNTARSIFAEAVANRLGRGHFCGFSAGMIPGDRLDPLVWTFCALRNTGRRFAAEIRRTVPRFCIHPLRSRRWRAIAALVRSAHHRGLALSRSCEAPR
jgi:hypothetical protein